MSDNQTMNVDLGMHSRTALLLGNDNLEEIKKKKVLIFGVGGVGSWCAEALVRSGICHLTIVDSDRICITNCNRQLMATSLTVGEVKVEALRMRLLEINPQAEITALQQSYYAESADSFHMAEYDFIVDAIDSLAEKADLILRATRLPKQVTFISSMGAALRTDPFQIRKAEFWKVKGDPLARALRNKFKKSQQFPARKFTCIYSEEPPQPNRGESQTPTSTPPDSPLMGGHDWHTAKVQVNGSLCHITALFGMSIAGIIIHSITLHQPTPSL